MSGAAAVSYASSQLAKSLTVASLTKVGSFALKQVAYRQERNLKEANREVITIDSLDALIEQLPLAQKGNVRELGKRLLAAVHAAVESSRSGEHSTAAFEHMEANNGELIAAIDRAIAEVKASGDDGARQGYRSLLSSLCSGSSHIALCRSRLDLFAYGDFSTTC